MILAWLAIALESPAAADQVEDQHNDGDHDKDVDKSPADVQSEAEQPQNQ